MTAPVYKPLMAEIAWLLVAIILSCLLTSFLFNWKLEGTVGIHFSDTYYVIASWIVLTVLFCFICFLLFLFKEIRNRFSKALPAFIIICSGILSIAALTIMMKFTPAISGFTMYPPLSALSDNWVDVGYDSEMILLVNILTAIQAILAGMVAYVAYRLGRSKHNQLK
jgi:hypothetical protein